MKCQLYVVPQVGTPEGRQRIRECMEGATRDNPYYAMLVGACDIIDRQAKQIEAKDATIENDVEIRPDKPTGGSLTHTLHKRAWDLGRTGWKLWAKDALELIDRQAERLNAKDAVLKYLRDNVSRDNVLSIQDIETLCKQGLRGNKNAVKNMEKKLCSTQTIEGR